MKSPFLLLLLLFAGAISRTVFADDAALTAADDLRIAAMISADSVTLSRTLSRDLHYAHANGTTDTFASLTARITSGELDYRKIHVRERRFIPLAEGIVMMLTEGDFSVAVAGQVVSLRLAALAVYRQEEGDWRLMAWQSNRLGP